MSDSADAALREKIANVIANVVHHNESGNAGVTCSICRKTADSMLLAAGFTLEEK